MQAEDLQRLELVTIDESTGFPFFGSVRVMMFGMSSLSRLTKDVIKSIGHEKSRIILSRYGYDAGMTMATAIADLYDFDSPIELLKAGSVTRTMAGHANENITDIDIDIDKGKLTFKGTWKNSFEALLWATRFGPSETPVCSILTGMASGFASAVMGKEVLVKEVSCKAQGQRLCYFEGRTVSEWGEIPEKVRKRFMVSSLDEELKSLKTDLSRAKKELTSRNREIKLLQKHADRKSLQDDMIFRSDSMANTLLLAEKVAPTSSTVLILGESGTGKEVLARFIHNRSGRKENPFLAINCAALPPNLLESELFGHAKGAFTGADQDKKGLFAIAGKGTIFLDEVGEMPIEVQAKLLRALQERCIRPLGEVKDVKIEARIIAATNRNLREMVIEGTFREDLFYRLSVFPVMIKPLRERRQDILLLARNFLARLNESHLGFSPAAVRQMESYSWPGNVRELENWIEYAVIMSGNQLISPEHLPLPSLSGAADAVSRVAFDFPTADELLRRYTRMVLDHTAGNKTEAARILDIGVSTLWRRLKTIEEHEGSE